MTEYIVRRTTLDNIILPEILYKYRKVNDINHLNILTNGTFYFSPPNEFPDKYDCHIPLRYDLLTYDDIYNRHVKSIKEKYPFKNRQTVRKEAREMVARGNFRNKKIIKEAEDEFWKVFNYQFGVLSLAKDNKSKRMWEEYANYLNGFCIGISPAIVFDKIGGGGDVSYYAEGNMPIIHPFEEHDILYQKLIYEKLDVYDFEKEYRTHKTWGYDVNKVDRNLKMAGSGFIELIVGENVEPIIAESLIDDARKLNPQIKLFTAKLVGDAIQII